MTSRPNIILLMSDQHRADLLGCAGDPVIQTPHIDRLAAEGAHYTNVHCQGPLCMPARASLLTERWVRDHGVFQNDWDVPADLPTFLHELQRVGYHTGCIGKMHLWVHGARTSDGKRLTHHTRERADQMRGYGFTEPIETVGKLASVGIESEYSSHLAEHGLLDTYRGFVAERLYAHHNQGEKLPNWDTHSIPLPAEHYIDAWHGDRVVRWIDEREGDDPWFLWVGFPGPHDPWDAPVEWVEHYADTELPMPASLERPAVPDEGPFYGFLNFFLWHHSDSATFTDERIQEVRRHYYANVSGIDAAVGRIRAALEAKGVADNTWIIYTSDHGEMMGEHRMLMKMVFYEPSVKVPVIIGPPGGATPTVVDDLVAHMDLSATIRAIAGAGRDRGFEGRSLLGDGPARPVVHSENYGFAMARTERHKLVYHQSSMTVGQLFDLLDDPLEDHNLIGDAGSRALIDGLLDDHVRPFMAPGRNTPGPGVFD